MGCSTDVIRRAELDLVRSLVPPSSQVLELGGARGEQARIIASWGCSVESIDIADRDVGDGLVFGVIDYDGVNIPFPDQSFDVVFSSNVLEHVQELPALLREVRRVLRPDGVGLHIMPTPAWRLWSSVTHYVSVGQYAAGAVRGRPPRQLGFFEGPRPAEVKASKSPARIARRALLPGAHGEFPSAAHEMIGFAAQTWRNVFDRAGFEVQDVRPSGIFYAGYGILPSLELAQRKRLSSILGSACNLYVTRPHRGDPASGGT